LRVYLPDHDLMAFAGAPAVYHCHHFNLFLDQTIDDALGDDAGARLRFQAAREAAHSFLRGLCVKKGAITPVEKMQCAAETFAAMGHGRLQITADENGGQAVGEFLHYGYSWHQKYGQKIRRKHPADAFAAGYAAAAVEVAFGLERETMDATEVACVVTRTEQCRFELRKAVRATPNVSPVRDTDVSTRVKPSFAGREETTIAAIAAGLRDFTAGVAGDERGLVQAFGVFVTMHLAGYYNRISYDAVAAIEKQAPGSVGVLEELLRESGHVCVFNTFGGILASPEWEGMVGKHSGQPMPIAAGSLAIARALGFGHWTLHDFEAGKRLVVRAPATYESVYWLVRHGAAKRPNEYFLQGAALAIAQLAHRVSWTERVELTPEVYQALFHGNSLPWRVEQTASTAMGQPYSEVIVSHVG
jgi:hypothetical protein